jgi:hypothetical protein
MVRFLSPWNKSTGLTHATLRIRRTKAYIHKRGADGKVTNNPYISTYSRHTHLKLCHYVQNRFPRVIFSIEDLEILLQLLPKKIKALFSKLNTGVMIFACTINCNRRLKTNSFCVCCLLMIGKRLTFILIRSTFC